MLVLVDLEAEEVEAGRNSHGENVPIDGDSKKSSPAANKNLTLWFASLCTGTESIIGAGTTPTYPFLRCRLRRCCIQSFLQNTPLIFWVPCPVHSGNISPSLSASTGASTPARTRRFVGSRGQRSRQQHLPIFHLHFHVSQGEHSSAPSGHHQAAQVQPAHTQEQDREEDSSTDDFPSSEDELWESETQR
ncbi:hypothetical protein SI65_10301 [Aspergillus cristatus]|uniref:Uncharacterized protein n=1 Tax=Aspergillus cristatus TaxID=573508 RepID=A0A1E3B051_ASPCR|nr:hypothetical protein SI65_10301 [Aspergillus cristatus]